MKPFMIAAAAALLLSVSAGFSLAGNVGFTRLTIADPMGGEMQVSVWYPTDASADRIKLGPYKFDAARDAAWAEGVHGLVVLSHGTEGSDLGHRNIAAALARRGVIGAAPLHPRDNFKDNSGVGRRIVMKGRPRRVWAVIDALLGHPQWESGIGAFGFSLGGYTVLAALGAQPDMMRIAEHCAGPTADPFCSFAGAQRDGLKAHVAREYPAAMAGLGDTRLCAASIADPVALPFPDAALAGIEARYIQMWRPEIENALEAKYHAARVVAQLNERPGVEPTSETVVKGAQHYSFLAPFPWRLTWVLPSEMTQDADGFDHAGFQKTLAQEVATFLDDSLARCAQDSRP